MRLLLAAVPFLSFLIQPQLHHHCMLSPPSVPAAWLPPAPLPTWRSACKSRTPVHVTLPPAVPTTTSDLSGPLKTELSIFIDLPSFVPDLGNDTTIWQLVTPKRTQMLVRDLPFTFQPINRSDLLSMDKLLSTPAAAGLSFLLLCPSPLPPGCVPSNMALTPQPTRTSNHVASWLKPPEALHGSLDNACAPSTCTKGSW